MGSYDLERAGRGETGTISALFDPQPGDVFRYRDKARWIVVAGRTESTVSLLFFSKRVIDGPFDSAESRVVRPEAFANAYLADSREVDPSSSLESRVALVSRGLLPVTEDFLCAACPVHARRKERLGRVGVMGWLVRNGWIKETKR